MRKSARLLTDSKDFLSFKVVSWLAWKRHFAQPQRLLNSISRPRDLLDELKAPKDDRITELGQRASKPGYRNALDQDLYLDVLESTATKREAKSYISHFGPAKEARQTTNRHLPKYKDIGVNLGSLYLPIRAVDEKPVFSQRPSTPQFRSDTIQPIHVALVKFRLPQSLDDATLHGVCHTLSQLARLDLNCVVVVDCEDGSRIESKDAVKLYAEQTDRIIDAIDACADFGARRLEELVCISPITRHLHSSIKIRGPLEIMNRDRFLAPLIRGMMPVVPPIVLDPGNQRLLPVAADEVVLALTRDIVGIQSKEVLEQGLSQVMLNVPSLQRRISLDRLIVLDPLGGIPSADQACGSHVFINLEQEFSIIRSELLDTRATSLQSTETIESDTTIKDLTSSPLIGRYIKKFLKSRVSSAQNDQEKHDYTARKTQHHSNIHFHLKNLELIRGALALLPPSSSAFLTTPKAVADSQSSPIVPSEGPRVRTRRQRNPLIHNLLTDKPAFSSSLPSNRSPASATKTAYPVDAAIPATFFKRGMPLSIVPDSAREPWIAPSASKPSIDLFDSRIDLSRLVHLIEDSFSRKLDVQHYLERIQDRIAGVIIAGEYEGGAILTWETPPGLAANDPTRMIPYLDKFAVLKRSQGAGGLADIVFKAMVRDCFPEGVCWRSRMDNPVNKWYFERARGTWKMLGTNWTMFWTTQGVEIGKGAFLDYEAVCKAVAPSWADKKSVID